MGPWSPSLRRPNQFQSLIDRLESSFTGLENKEKEHVEAILLDKDCEQNDRELDKKNLTINEK